MGRPSDEDELASFGVFKGLLLFDRSNEALSRLSSSGPAITVVVDSFLRSLDPCRLEMGDLLLNVDETASCSRRYLARMDDVTLARCDSKLCR
jgi:hypothetical protein